MPRATASEWILARFTTHARAAAILGDLTELAATRGHLWFWTTYVRTMVLLGWRTAFAFVVGYASLVLLYKFYTVAILWRILASPLAWHTVSHPYIREAIFFLAIQLWFLVPFVVARYGVANRLARLGLFAALISTGIILCAPSLTLVLVVAAMIAIAVSLSCRSWQPPAILLLATTSVGAFTLLNLQFLAHMLCWIDEHKPLNASSHYRFFDTGFAFSHNFFWIVMWSMALLDASVLAFTYSVLHRWLLESTEPTHRKNSVSVSTV